MVKELIYKLFKLEDLPCKSCEVLKSQLEIVNYEKKELLNNILSLTRPQVEERVITAIDPIKPKTVPWTVRRQMIETEDRIQAQKLREKQKEIEELEKEVGLEDASSQQKAV